jgi:glycine cleavage system regulatory protein
MNHSLVLTLLGNDRPGLVESVATLVREHDGNWQESRMCRLGGQFAGIVQLTIPNTRYDAWTQAVESLQESGLKITLSEDSLTATPTAGKSAVFEIVGQDQSGIIQKITSALAKHQVNVDDLTSECSSAPWSGEPLFKARAEVRIPDSCQINQLRDDLEKIAADLMVDITFD